MPEKSDCLEVLTDYMKKDECDHEHFMMKQQMDEKEKRYREVINNSVEERKAIWVEIKETNSRIERNTDKVNGKFDKIVYGFVGILLAICASTIGMVITQINAKADLKTDMDKRFQVALEGRAYHQNISQQNNAELIQVINRLDTLSKKLERVAR